MLIGIPALLLGAPGWMAIPLIVAYVVLSSLDAHEKDKRKRNPEYY